ncbi:uncharacterized protein TEOVI_000564800 [Trypanosoma equiperdum]|uniref:Uncharacterized protein n=3 Tax=Trypanozoon TaxID=39700 RepID=Q580T4_TRYB2|nr:hypothetical protein, conserved [Trypanosoma brucei brucei TREU927]AAX81050.1 hypothetical protein, conserved [Trypanosoma brucei]RHW73443.1 hypothetical protein DPX39_030053400 [Trypanosoma brucei equiperdum]SCU67857.1 hypothetical protein, conserved [Trypanosoma equiperdum]AAZ10572.1 hypothetical protein, conserved [Trypanosoma brucei brucei TREU927]RHW73455.1 hypothetical protein DPX39_030068400 [Trypanosoma brucei equiperdum]
MLRLSSRCHLYEKLGRTKLGAEVLLKTRNDMRGFGKDSNFIVRFLARRRPIDFLALEVDGRLARELHPSFRIVKNACTLLLMGPVFVMLVSGMMSPTYYLLVSTNIMTVDRYNGLWEFSHWAVVLCGQLFVFIFLYDLSVYVRYPFFAYILVPMYRRLGLQRHQNVTVPLDEVRRRARAKPLGAPLSTVGKKLKNKRTGTRGS